MSINPLDKSGFTFAVSTLWGKITGKFDALAKVAKSGSYIDLNNKPTIPDAVRVKGNAENTYRVGDVNLTPEDIGLGNVGDFKSVSTVASQGLTEEEKANARGNIGLNELSSGGIHISPEAPTDTNLLWVDTGIGGVIKYYDADSETWKQTLAVWG